MRNTVWKYAIKHGVNTISIPHGRSILQVGEQNGLILWALVDIDSPPVETMIAVVYTGEEIPEGIGDTMWVYVGTIQQHYLVYHVFQSVHKKAIINDKVVR